MKYNWFAIKLVIICVIVFILQNLIPSLTDEFALVSSDFLSRPWTIITYIFLHGSLLHIFYNMFALALFGSILERVVGEKNFLLIFFASGIVAGIGSILFYQASIGASGAIYGVMGALAVLRPRMTVVVGYGVPMPMALAVALWAVGDFIGFFSPDEVAYAAHLFGLAVGLVFGFFLRKKYGELSQHHKNREKINEEKFRDWEDRWLRLSDSDF